MWFRLLVVQVVAVLVPQLRQQQAAEPQHTERVPPRVRPILQAMSVNVPYRLREAEAAARPPQSDVITGRGLRSRGLSGGKSGALTTPVEEEARGERRYR